MSYKHFTRKERNFIEENLKLGISKREIAKKLGRHHSSICDEVNRNCFKSGEYIAFPADMKYSERRIKREYTSKDIMFLIGYIRNKILATWFPEQISNRLKLEYPENKRKQISTTKIYKMIYGTKIAGITRKLLEIKTYFTDPHSLWQRPTNENTNGLIREFYPKKFDLATITQQEVDRVAELINNRPRKCLGWYSATEVFRNRKNIKKNNTIK